MNTMRRWVVYGWSLLILVVLPLLGVYELPSVKVFVLVLLACAAMAACFPVYFGLKEPPRHD